MMVVGAIMMESIIQSDDIDNSFTTAQDEAGEVRPGSRGSPSKQLFDEPPSVGSAYGRRDRLEKLLTKLKIAIADFSESFARQLAVDPTPIQDLVEARFCIREVHGKRTITLARHFIDPSDGRDKIKYIDILAGTLLQENPWEALCAFVRNLVRRTANDYARKVDNKRRQDLPMQLGLQADFLSIEDRVELMTFLQDLKPIFRDALDSYFLRSETQLQGATRLGITRRQFQRRVDLGLALLRRRYAVRNKYSTNTE